MTTRIINARDGIITDEILKLAKIEGVNPKNLNDLIASGQAIVISNKNRNISPIVIGHNLKTKICVSLVVDDKDGSLACEADKLILKMYEKCCCLIQKFQ